MNRRRGAHSRAGPANLANADWLKREATQSILRELSNAGYVGRIVGGAVRNALLGMPVRDIDIATDASPDDVVRLFERGGYKVIPTGLKHGTVTVIAQDSAYEVTTLREDVATDGRHAEVRFTDDWAGDASRRDFTINALYCQADGEIFDPLGGLADIEHRSIRFIGDPSERIREDYLRILRFFRFFAEYGRGDIDRAGLAACVAGRLGARRLSSERIREELLRLLVAPRAMDALQAMFEFGLIGEFIPAAPRLNRLARLSGIDRDRDSVLRLAVASVGVLEDGERIADRLKLSNDHRRRLCDVDFALSVHSPLTAKQARQLIYRLGAERFNNCIKIARSRSYHQLSHPDWIASISLAKHWAAPHFPLSGADALQLGAVPGPQVGAALKRVEALWIESDFTLNENSLRKALAQAVSKS